MADTVKNPSNPNASDLWRIDNARHLAGLKLHHRAYARYSKSWGHDHCAACFAKFAEVDGADIQRVGYATGDDYKFGSGYEWVCEQCFADLKPVLGWTADEGEEKKPLQSAVRALLLRDWGPIGISDVAKVADEYDTYVAPIADLVAARNGPDEVAAYLLKIETDRMGLKGDAARARSVAQKLCALAPSPR